MTSMGWTVETVSAVDAEIEALPTVVENVGLEALRAPHVRHLEGKLRELRVRAEGGGTARERMRQVTP